MWPYLGEVFHLKASTVMGRFPSRRYLAAALTAMSLAASAISFHNSSLLSIRVGVAPLGKPEHRLTPQFTDQNIQSPLNSRDFAHNRLDLTTHQFQAKLLRRLPYYGATDISRGQNIPATGLGRPFWIIHHFATRSPGATIISHGRSTEATGPYRHITTTRRFVMQSFGVTGISRQRSTEVIAPYRRHSITRLSVNQRPLPQYLAITSNSADASSNLKSATLEARAADSLKPQQTRSIQVSSGAPANFQAMGSRQASAFSAVDGAVSHSLNPSSLSLGATGTSQELESAPTRPSRHALIILQSLNLQSYGAIAISHGRSTSPIRPGSHSEIIPLSLSPSLPQPQFGVTAIRYLTSLPDTGLQPASVFSVTVGDRRRSFKPFPLRQFMVETIIQNGNSSFPI